MNITESPSIYQHLDKMPVGDLLRNINNEDKTVPNAVEKVIPEVERLVKVIVTKMKKGGRLFYIGAGTSGRLGIIDASECPPTFGVSPDKVIGLIAGGMGAIQSAVEFAEDDPEQGWKDLKEYKVNEKDVVVGISASGHTPYVLGAIKDANKKEIFTACITCNPDTEIGKEVDIPIEVIVGPEFVTGSTRMKAGTAQKLILNMISTAVMIQLGKVKGNKMVDMQLSNKKLFDRGTRMIMEELSVEKATAEELLLKHGSVRKVIQEEKNA